MKNIEIFDPAMCCSTGVCGPSINPDLIRMATVINALKGKGIIIKRHGLSAEPQDFISNKVVSEILQKEGADILPVTLVDGKIGKTKEYPTNEELSDWLGIKIKTTQQQPKGGCGCGTKGCC
ncbi:arsenite efflux transporter metallochaperone ArsD [Dehalococcoides mccartyi]|uniref:arsenite efflux transporter metallochaperone ArsD n=1 Tax=Dehalococcoides mccartyi TaxID=61435 RepID=UPI0002B76DC1|nr:arsenite efflux transporter metallochaperone ArsD [Dehalococcoides mccartyi]AGG05964.1 arsenical resistance operon trans-acting repressor ArsD [Dehalococcoides mccartyi DCMB5]